MKKLLIYLFIGLILSLLPIKSQVNVNINFGTPPPWGYVEYTDVRYYYIPDIEVYYDIQLANFIYWNGGRWVYSEILPVRYARYDLYGCYKVMMYDYYGPKPFIYFKSHKMKYPKGYSGPHPEKMHPKGKPGPLYKMKGSSPGKKNNKEGNYKKSGNKGSGKNHG